jgi:hypothetical protein
VSWAYLARFAALPVFWATAVLVAYALLAVFVISPGNRWQAAEVFLGVAGGGAAIAALAGLAHQFQPDHPELELQVDAPGGKAAPPLQRTWSVYVTNKGRSAAYGTTVHFSAHGIDHEAKMTLQFEQKDFWAGPARLALFNQGGDPGNWSHILELQFSREIPAGTFELPVAKVLWAGQHLTVTARCENMRGARPTWNSQTQGSGVSTVARE